MFNYIDHVAIVVEDIEESTEFFEEVYDLECWGTNSEEHRQEHGIDAAFFDVGESVLELVSPVEEGGHGGWAADRLEKYGEGFFHIAYAVDDIYEAMDKLREHGVRFEDDEPGMGFSGKLITCNPEDTIMPIQLVEPNGHSD